MNAYLGELESDLGGVRSLAGWSWIEDNVRRLSPHYVAPSKWNDTSVLSLKFVGKGELYWRVSGRPS